MGWLYSSGWGTANAVRDHLRDQLRQAGYTILDDASTKYGRVYYALIEKPALPDKPESAVTPTIFVALINGGRGSDWGYKDMDESMGPVEVDCPLRLIDKAGPPPNDWARDWREKVRAYHARRKVGADVVKHAKRGDKVWLEYAPEPYTVAWTQKKSLVAYRADGRGPYRLPTAKIIRFEAAL